MKNEIPVQSFDSGGTMNRQQVWNLVGVILPQARRLRRRKPPPSPLSMSRALAQALAKAPSLPPSTRRE